MKNLINRALVAEKKILYVAVMALTMVFWVSCSNNPRVEMKYADGDWPDVADLKKYTHFSSFFLKKLAYVRKKQYLCSWKREYLQNFIYWNRAKSPFNNTWNRVLDYET